jgi:hypothetical protein
VTALNERLSKGITPENNANVLIWQALGPHPEGGTMPSEYFHLLGIESPPEQGEYLVGWPLKEDQKIRDRIQRNPESDPMVRGRNWPWTAKDEPELADYLKRNEKPLALLMEATRRPEYYNPLAPNRTEESSAGLIGALLPQVQKCREAANALTCRAMLRVADGKVDEAWQDLLACHRLGRLIARGGTLIEVLVGIAINQVANEADVAFIDHAKLTSKQVLACLDDLRKLPPMPPLADKIDLGERFMFLDTVMLISRQGTALLAVNQGASSLEDLGLNNRPLKGDQAKAKLFTRSVNWDPALRNANRWFDRYVVALRIMDRTARELELAAIDQDLKILKKQVADTGPFEMLSLGPQSRGEMIGNIMISLMLPAFDKIQGAMERCEQGQRNLHLAFALAAYQRYNRHYPAKLEELAPKYVESIPDDLFSGNPLIYRLVDKGYLLYSVGPNGKDEEGRGNNDEPRGDDLSVRMPMPKPVEKK